MQGVGIKPSLTQLKVNRSNWGAFQQILQRGLNAKLLEALGTRAQEGIGIGNLLCLIKGAGYLMER